jgi:hypothetical protein
MNCTGCDRPGVPYIYRDIQFDGLHAYHGERLCSACLRQGMEQNGVTIRVEDRFRFRAYTVNSRAHRDTWFPGAPLSRAFDPDGRF